ncbi:MAG: hypothetical protein AMXMBFR64_01480 [Myxococcales bacterium]
MITRALLLVALLVSPGEAQELAALGERAARGPTPTDLYEAGRRAWQEGDHAGAVDLLERAFTLLPDPTFVFNKGVVLEEAGKYEEALDAYRQYVTLSTDGDGIEQAVARMEATRAAFGQGRLTVVADGEGEVFIDDKSVGRTPLVRELVPAGPRRVRVQAPGRPPLDLVATVVPGESREVAVTLRPESTVAAPPPAARPLRDWGIAVSVSGGAVLAAGIALVVVGDERRDGGYDGGGDLERSIGVGLTTAGGLAAAAGVLMAVLGEADPPPAVWVAPSGQGGVAVGAGF